MRVVENQQAALQNAIINIEEELVLAVLNKVTNAFEDKRQIVNEEDKNKAEAELAKLLAVFYLIIVPMQARTIISRRISEFGMMGTFELTAEVNAYIGDMAHLAASSHTETILEDLLTAARVATYTSGADELISLILTAYPNSNREAIMENIMRAAAANKGDKAVAEAIHESYEKIKLEDIFAGTRAAALKGASEHELTSFIKAQYQKISTHRAKTIARTETNRAFTRAQYEADLQFLQENDLMGRAYKKWVTRSDNPCPFCQMKAKEPPIPFKTAFGEVGDVWTAIFELEDGTTSVRKLPINYETIQAGNAHVNCFCIYQLIIQ
jgi:hypothetical protein